MATKKRTPGGARLSVDTRPIITRIEVDRYTLGECTPEQEDAIHALALAEADRLAAQDWESPFYAGGTVWLVSTVTGPDVERVLARLYGIEAMD